LSEAKIYYVKVRFGSSRLSVDGDHITVGLKSKPKLGRANRELVRRLADHFDVGEENVRILSGRTSRKKVVEVRAATGG
jgi:hypothetical protein